MRRENFEACCGETAMTQQVPAAPVAGNDRVMHVMVAVLLTGAFVGLFTGIEGSRGVSKKAHQPNENQAAAVVASTPAPGYRDLRAMRRGPNAHLYDDAFDALEKNQVDLYQPVQQTPEDKEGVLKQRAERRAYDGAPPTIPHNIDQMALPDCLGCHETGATVVGKRAPKMSHRRLESCTQCHAAGSDPRPGNARLTPPPNDFVGMASPSAGTRAWPGAPPTIPHSTTMRTECTACHGTTGPLGIKSTHPYRQSCQQCHAPSAILDQHAPSFDAQALPKPGFTPAITR